jgi:hypothetical protein
MSGNLGKIFDASKPPKSTPERCAGVMGYIGMEGRTPHVWTSAEWRVFGKIRQYPVWVPDYAYDGGANARYAVQAVTRLGWAAHEAYPRAIIVDMETVISPQWYDDTAAGILAAGFTPVCYGSMSTVFQNRAVDVIAADYDGVASVPAGQTLHGWQYIANQPWDGTTVDYSVFDQWLMDRGGVGPRK